MNVVTVFEGVLVSCVEKSYVSKKTGQPGVIYNLGVRQESGIAELNTTKEVFDAYVAGKIKDFAKYKFHCQYDTVYRNFRVVGIA